MAFNSSTPEADTRILLVEDDVRLSTLIQEYLQQQALSVSIEHRGNMACQRILSEIPVKQEEQPPPPKPEKQPTPKKTVAKKPSSPSEPELSPRAKKIVEEIPSEPVAHNREEKIVEKIEEAAEPTPPMLIEPAEDALPNPVPIFKLTQAPRFLHREIPVYPETMRTQGISGIVRLEALIDKKGRVRKVNILKSAGKHFDKAARRAILASSFYPAEVENEPVAVLLRLPVSFDLL